MIGLLCVTIATFNSHRMPQVRTTLGNDNVGKAAAAFSKGEPNFAPVTSSDFQEQVLAIGRAMTQKDFSYASRLAENLPKSTLRAKFDFSSVAAADRSGFDSAARRAAAAWQMPVVTDGKVPDLLVSFQPKLAIDSTTNGPANVVTFRSDVAGQPKLHAFIGLHRGKPERTATENDVFNDVRYAIGDYLGVATHQLNAYVMTTIAQTDEPRTLNGSERFAAKANIGLSERLRAAIAARKVLNITGPSEASVSPRGFEGEAIQGEQIDLPINLTNKGKGWLIANAVGDCGCVVLESAPAVGPGSTGVMRLRLETKQYTGPMVRSVLLFTNDPNLPMQTIPIHVTVTPRYRFLVPEGSVWVVDKGGRTGDVYFTYPKASPFLVTHVVGVGLEGVKVDSEPWTGDLPDPELNEPKTKRQGLHLKIFVPDTIPTGRKSISIAILTTDGLFPSIYYNLQVQKGIVSLPEEVFLGEVGTKPQKKKLLLSRPGRPFSILGVSSDLAFCQVKMPAPGKAPEHVLEFVYDGKAGAGDFNGDITVITDDPRQKTIKIPISGSSASSG